MVLLRGTTDRLIDGRYYSMEMNVEKNGFKQLPQAQIVHRSKTTENEEYFNHLDNLVQITQDVHVKLNPRLAW